MDFASSAGALESGLAAGPSFAPTGTGLGGGAADTGIGAGASDTGIANAMDQRLASGTAGTTGIFPQASSSTSFLDTLLNKAEGMVNNRGVMNVVGNVLSGAAQGRAQQAKIDADRANTQDARANARFGNVDSRYNNTGMAFNTPTYR